MFIIGELINGMYSNIAKAIREKDRGEIQKCALKQINAGADALDINCGVESKQPLVDMPWLVETIQEVTDKTLVLDSSKPQIIEAGLKKAKNPAIINSTTADLEKLNLLVPMAKAYQSKLVGLTISTKGIPQNKDQRLELAALILASCADQGLLIENLFLDPVVMPLNVAQSQIRDILESIRDLKIISGNACKTIIGLSNISQGATNRRLINRTFLVMADAFGLDAAILDPKDSELMDACISADVILAKQIYCSSYLEAYRKK